MTISKWFLAALLAVSGVSGAVLNNVVSAGNDCATVAERIKQSDAATQKFQERQNTRGGVKGY
ncbi:hypothetical protein [Yersinia rohdei]|uniref:hypothetical protein n=1 Tax=Yersinia rohdei TaxID=29485 RepID=UPI0025AA4702|nr:hypothetical protein [Yersinia rohdei]MDN0096258.1 hypothetical protein [Yersinia rohdei]